MHKENLHIHMFGSGNNAKYNSLHMSRQNYVYCVYVYCNWCRKSCIKIWPQAVGSGGGAQIVEHLYLKYKNKEKEAIVL